MSQWTVNHHVDETQLKYKQRGIKKKDLMLALLVPLALAIMSIPLYLWVIMKVIEVMQ